MPQPPSPAEMLKSLNAKSVAQGLAPVVAVPGNSPVETPPVAQKPVETPPAAPATPPAAPAVETPPAAPAADPLADILGDAKPAAEPASPSDKEHNFREVRRQLKERDEALKRIADEKAERETELEQLRGELAKRDLTYDPQFEDKFVKPEAQLLLRVKGIAQTFGADPNEVERLLNLPGVEFQKQWDESKLGGAVKQQLLSAYVDLTNIRNDKQVALANAHQTQAKFAEARRQEHTQQLQQMTQARNQTFSQAIRNTVAADTTGFFAVKEGVSTVDDVRATVLTVKNALDAAPGVPPTQHFENQVKLMYKGAAFDRAVAKLDETQKRLDAVLAEAKRLNIPITISQGQVQVPASAKPAENGPKTPQQLMADLQAGKFSPGGELYKFQNR